MLPHTGSRFLSELNATDASLAKLARNVSLDPVLSLHLFTEAHKLRKDASTSITRVDHCLSTLGITRIKEIANSIPILKIARRSYCYQRYLSSIQLSQFAASLTNSWSTSTFLRTDNPLHFPTLFYGVGVWYLWRFELERIFELEELIFNQRISNSDAEMQVFGCRIKEISAAIIQQCGLPSISGDALSMEWQLYRRNLATIHLNKVDEDKRDLIPDDANTMILKSDTAKVCLANELAYQIQHRPSCHPHHRRIMKVSAALLNRSLESHKTKTRQQTLVFSNSIRYPGIQAPAAALLFIAKREDPQHNKISYLGKLQSADLKIKTNWLPENEKPALRNLQSSASHTGTNRGKANFAATIPDLWKYLHETSSKGKKLHQEAFRGFMSKFKDLPLPENDSDIHETVKFCTTALTNYVGFPRVAFFQLQKNNTIQYLCGAGFQNQGPNLKTSFPNEPPQLVDKLRDQPTGFWLKPENNDKVLPLLAKGILRISHDQGFLLMSIFRNEKAIGLFYCDRRGLNDLIDEDQYKAFKQLCQACSFILSK